MNNVMTSNKAALQNFRQCLKFSLLSVLQEATRTFSPLSTQCINHVTHYIGDDFGIFLTVSKILSDNIFPDKKQLEDFLLEEAKEMGL